jgi:Holliday junction resolvase RusA-like endonuclease
MLKSVDIQIPYVKIENGPPYKFEIFLAQQPVPWKRAMRHGDKYYDSQTKDKLFYALTFAKHFTHKPFTGPVAVHLEFRIKPPRTLIAKYGGKLEGIDHARKADLDNYVKFVLDALTPRAWKDDSLIVALKARKCWSFDPGTLITVYEVPELLPDPLHTHEESE